MRQGLGIDKILHIAKSRGYFWLDRRDSHPIKKKCNRLVKQGSIKESFRNKHGIYYVPVKEVACASLENQPQNMPCVG